MPEVKYRTCNLCEAMCGLAITVDGGRIVDVRGDDQDPFSRGHVCPKGPAMRELQEDPDRLRQPVRRVGDRWETIGWNEALDEVAAGLAGVQERHGRSAVATYVGNPTVHNHATILGAQLLNEALGTKARFDANSLDANPKLLSCLHMYGDLAAIPIPDVDRTDFLLVVGANPAASNGSLMTMGDVRGRLKGVRERGGRLVVVDPRRTETAAWADEHLFIRPGADPAFALAFLHVLFAERLVDEGAVARIASGVNELRRLVAPWTPERVEPATGIPAGELRRLAIAFGRAKSAICYGRVGTCLNEYGTTTSWLLDAINVVTGNFDRPGGVMFPTPAIDPSALLRLLGANAQGRWRTRVRGLPELAGQLPTAALAEEMEMPGPGQIRGFVSVAGNPVLSSPNGERLASSLAGLEYMVAIDLYVNETTRHANIILPPRYALERTHFDLVFNALAVRNVIKWGEPVLPSPEGSKTEWDIALELAVRLWKRRANPALRWTLSPLSLIARRLGVDGLVDFLIRVGPRGDKFLPWSKGLNLARIKQAPHGLDLGPLEPAHKKKVRTDSGLVELVPPALVADLARVERLVDGAHDNGLVLIGRRHLRSNNSWMHNVTSLTKGPSRAALLMHPDDARRLGLRGGERVSVKSRVGQITALLEESDAIMRGVVSLPHGFGHARSRDTLHVAGAIDAPSINDLTDELRVEPLSGTAALNGTPVTVESVA